MRTPHCAQEVSPSRASLSTHARLSQGFAAALYVGITKQQLDATVGIHPSSAEEFVCLAKPTRQYRDGKLTEGEEP